MKGSHKPKTLVILTPGFPADENDSTCLPSQQLFVRTLNQLHSELKVVILTLEYPFRKGCYNWQGNTVIALNTWHAGKIKKARSWVACLRKVRGLRRQHHVIGIFSFFCSEAGFVAAGIGRLLRIPWFAWISGQDAKKENKYVRRMRPAASNLVAMSDFLSDVFYASHGIRPAHVVPNATAREMFSRPKRAREIDVLAAGSLIPLKQYHIFVDVIARLRDTIPSIRAVHVGDGDGQDELKTMIHRLGLDEHVLLRGKLDHAGLLDIMQTARVFLHPSSYEGFSTVCLEALYAGAHVISFTQPMHHPIKHWHVVASPEEMYEKALAILRDHQTDYSAVLPFEMRDSVEAIMELFCYNDSATD